MKKLIMMMAVAIAAAMPIMAETEIVGNIEWEYERDWEEDRLRGMSVTGARSTETETYTYYYYGYRTGTRRKALSGSVSIPSKLGGYPVTRIGSSNSSMSIFEHNNQVTEVRIPDSVIHFNSDALIEVNNDAYIDTETMPGLKLVDGWVVGYTDELSGTLDLSGVRGVAGYAFRKELADYPYRESANITSVIIPNGVTRIWDHSFSSCRELKSVTIPDSVTSIGEGAFGGCSGLMSVTIPNNVTRIGDEAFLGCSGLTSIVIPNSVISIGWEAFSYCDGITSLTVPSNVKTIERLAFARCDNLKKVVLPKWCKGLKMYWNGDDWEPLKGGKLSLGRTLHEDEYIVDFIYFLFADEDGGESYELVKKKIKITYKDVKGGASGGDVAEMWKKAQTLDGAVFRDGKAAGVVQVKVGKASKNGEVAVSGTITGLDGKKLTAKGGKVAVNGESATATLAVKDGTAATVTIGKNGVSGSWNGAEIKSAEVGGNWTRTDAKVYVDAANLPAGTIEELLPDGEPVLAKGGKWAFNKGASVKLSKDKSKAEWDTSGGKSNLSSMKLTYTPKTGLFKGSFKVYALEAAKLKKYTANVTGVVVDGKGYGQATIKKPVAGPWAVTVE